MGNFLFSLGPWGFGKKTLGKARGRGRVILCGVQRFSESHWLPSTRLMGLYIWMASHSFLESPIGRLIDGWDLDGILFYFYFCCMLVFLLLMPSSFVWQGFSACFPTFNWTIRILRSFFSRLSGPWTLSTWERRKGFLASSRLFARFWLLIPVKWLLVFWFDSIPCSFEMLFPWGFFAFLWWFTLHLQVVLFAWFALTCAWWTARLLLRNGSAYVYRAVLPSLVLFILLSRLIQYYSLVDIESKIKYNSTLQSSMMTTFCSRVYYFKSKDVKNVRFNTYAGMVRLHRSPFTVPISRGTVGHKPYRLAIITESMVIST